MLQIVVAMMKLLFPLCLLPLCLSFDIPRQGCDHQVKIGEHRYNLSHTVDLGNASAVDAHYDVYGNLFYVNSSRTNGENFFNVYMIERNTQVPIKVGGLPDGRSYSVAVDKTYADVYFGTNKGIFRFNYETFQAVLDSDGDMKVDMLYIDNDGNKYITEGNNGVEEVYFLDGVKKVRYNALEALNEMAIDDKNNFYYIRDESFYILKSDSLKPDLIGNVTYYGVAQIAFYKDYVFIASERLVYYNENMNTELKHIENIPVNAKAVAFDDNGNFMLGTDGKLMKYDKSDCFIRKE